MEDQTEASLSSDLANGTTGAVLSAPVDLSPSIVAKSEMLDDRLKAKMQGYEGDPCGDCGNYTLVRNGTCMKCNTCGSTSGCS